MNESNLREVLAQASESEAVKSLQQILRQSIRMPLYAAIEQEVNLLAGLYINPRRANTSEPEANTAVFT